MATYDVVHTRAAGGILTGFDAGPRGRGDDDATRTAASDQATQAAQNILGAPKGPPRRLALPGEPMTNTRFLDLYDTFDPHSTNHKKPPLAEAPAVGARFVKDVKRVLTANGIPHRGDLPSVISRSALAKIGPRLAHILQGTAQAAPRRRKSRLYKQRSRALKAKLNGKQP